MGAKLCCGSEKTEAKYMGAQKVRVINNTGNKVIEIKEYTVRDPSTLSSATPFNVIRLEAGKDGDTRNERDRVAPGNTTDIDPNDEFRNVSRFVMKITFVKIFCDGSFLKEVTTAQDLLFSPEDFVRYKTITIEDKTDPNYPQAKYVVKSERRDDPPVNGSSCTFDQVLCS